MITLTSRAYHNDVFPEYAKFICDYFGYERMMPMNTGVEAVETAMKLARSVHPYPLYRIIYLLQLFVKICNSN